MSAMEDEIRGNLHRYAVGGAMFCRDCRKVLDEATSAVYRASVRCNKCWEKNTKLVVERHGPELVQRSLDAAYEDLSLSFGSEVRLRSARQAVPRGPKKCHPNQMEMFA